MMQPNPIYIVIFSFSTNRFFLYSTLEVKPKAGDKPGGGAPKPNGR